MNDVSAREATPSSRNPAVFIVGFVTLVVLWLPPLPYTIHATDLPGPLFDLLRFVRSIKPDESWRLRWDYFILPPLFIYALWMTWRSRGTLAESGLTAKNFGAACRALAMPTLIGAAILLLIGAAMHSGDYHERFWKRLNPLNGLVQQLAIQLFFHRQLMAWFGAGRKTAWILTLFFVALHAPNAALMVGTLYGMYFWARAYQKAPNLYAIAISHALLSALLMHSLPEKWKPTVSVGYRYLEKMDAKKKARAVRELRKAARFVPGIDGDELFSFRRDEEAIVEAVQRGDLAAVRELLRGDPRLANAREHFSGVGTPALVMACRNGHREIAELLLDHGADVQASSVMGWNALDAAVDEGRREVVGMLLSREMDARSSQWADLTPYLKAASRLKADGSQRRRRGRDSQCFWLTDRALHSAIISGQRDIARLLRSYGAMAGTELDEACAVGDLQKIAGLLQEKPTPVPPIPPSGEITPLHQAVFWEQESAAVLLITHGADVNAAPWSETPLHWAAKVGSRPMTDFLLAHGSRVNTTNWVGQTALHVLAKRSGDPAVARLLLAARASVSPRDLAGNTPLILAVQGGHADMVGLLLNHKADPNIRHENGSTALFLAAGNGHAEIVSLLLTAKADPRIPGPRPHDASSTETPLMAAARHGHLDVANLLLDHGCKADERVSQGDGWTPLLLACETDHPEMVKLLLSRTRDINARYGKYKYTQLHFAAEQNLRKSVSMLLDHGADLRIRDDRYENTAFELAIERGSVEAMDLFLTRGADLNFRNPLSLSTPLHVAASRGTPVVVERLLAKQAHLQAQNDFGETPLHMAAFHGTVGVVKVLLDHKADPNAKDRDGETPLHRAVVNGREEIVNLLLDHGADATIRNRKGETVLQVAVQNDHAETARLIRAHETRQARR